MEINFPQKRFSKAVALGGGGAQHRHSHPLPFGEGAGGGAALAFLSKICYNKYNNKSIGGISIGLIHKRTYTYCQTSI